MKIFSAIQVSSYGDPSAQILVLSEKGRVLLQADLPGSFRPGTSLGLVHKIARSAQTVCVLAWDPEQPCPCSPRTSRWILPLSIEPADYRHYDLDPLRCEHCPPDPYASVRRMAMIGALKYVRALPDNGFRRNGPSLHRALSLDRQGNQSGLPV